MAITRDQAPGGVSDVVSPYDSLAATTTSAVEVLMSYIVTLTASGTETLTPGNSFAILDESSDGNAACTGASSSRAVTATGTFNSTFTSTGAGTTGAVVFLVTYAAPTITQAQHTFVEALVGVNVSVGPTPTKNTTNGSTFSVFVAWYGGDAAPLTVTDNKSNVYTLVGLPVACTADTNLKGALFEKINGVGGTGHTWSAAFATGQSVITLFAVELTEGGSITFDLGLQPPQQPRPLPRHYPDNWDPLPALIVQALAKSASFSQLAPRPRPRAPLPVGWEPLPVVIPQPTGWGFSPGVQIALPAPRVDAWEPLRSLQQQASPASLEFDSPLPKTPARARVAAWEPVASVVQAAVECTAPTVAPARARARVDGWEPLPDVVTPAAAAVSVDVASPVAPARARARVDGWEPLPDVVTPAAAAVSVDVASPVAPARARARVDGWEPLPDVVTPAAAAVSVDVASPVAPARARARVDGWEPLAALPVPASPDVASPVAPARARARVEAWTPPGASSSAFAVECASPALPLRARARVDGWDPLPAVTPLPPSNWGFEAGPINARVKAARPEYWEPLPDLIPPPLNPQQPFIMAAMA